jgi:large subunit ribosomal protein L28
LLCVLNFLQTVLRFYAINECLGGKFSIFIFQVINCSLPLPSEKKIIMARVCQLTGKRPITGNTVSHSNIKTRRRFLPNLQTKKYFLAEEDKWVTLKISTEGIRTINKNGLYSVVKELRSKGVKI